MLKVLQCLYEHLKPGGAMILKEPVLEEHEKDARFTNEGQFMLVRPAKKIENWLNKYFKV